MVVGSSFPGLLRGSSSVFLGDKVPSLIEEPTNTGNVTIVIKVTVSHDLAMLNRLVD